MRTSIKNLIVAAMALVMLVGVVDAFSNLPVVTGCSYYGRCSSEAVTD